ncbi:MAG: hypothetical protein N3D11_13940 [Candidatus Sumerlaeia bacterium]|nr:hypothetical protein [Candidatus Sumerlaeia bacterium]
MDSDERVYNPCESVRIGGSWVFGEATTFRSAEMFGLGMLYGRLHRILLLYHHCEV